jgi:hypothetical protein
VSWLGISKDNPDDPESEIRQERVELEQSVTLSGVGRTPLEVSLRRTKEWIHMDAEGAQPEQERSDTLTSVTAGFAF